MPYSPLGLRLQGKPALQKHPRFLDGSFEVQDEGSQLLGQLLAPRRGEMVAISAPAPAARPCCWGR
jgi:16S rRNA (cytosine967-C5)-methyltransferase